MPITATDNVVCISCGADVRSESLFCYNCGGSVAKGPVSSEGKGDESDPGRSADASGARANESANKPPSPALRPSAGPESPSKVGGKPLTAAMLRRKRAYNRQAVEVVWEEPEGRPTVFAIASAILTIIAALILAAALYLK
jgi:hypothetical protein